MGRSAVPGDCFLRACARRSLRRACGRSSIFSPASCSIGLAGARRVSRRLGSIGGPASSRARFTARCSWASSLSPPCPARARRGGDPRRRRAARRPAWRRAPLSAGQTIVGSADGTAPFFGRLMRAYRDPRGPARGLVVGLGLALAYRANLAATTAARAFSRWRVGALCYGGVDLAFDASVMSGERRKLPSWRLYALGFCSAASSPARSAGISTRRSSGRRRQILGLRRRQLSLDGRRSATSSPIRSSTNTGRLISARSRAGSGCSGRNRLRA